MYTPRTNERKLMWNIIEWSEKWFGFIGPYFVILFCAAFAITLLFAFVASVVEFGFFIIAIPVSAVTLLTGFLHTYYKRKKEENKKCEQQLWVP